MQKDIQLFYCYDKRLHFYIRRHNISYLTKARALNSDKIFTLYQWSEQLDKVIKSYKKEVISYGTN